MGWGVIGALLIIFCAALGARNRENAEEEKTSTTPVPSPGTTWFIAIAALVLCGGGAVWLCYDAWGKHQQFTEHERKTEECFQGWETSQADVRVIGGRDLILCEIVPTKERYWFAKGIFEQEPRNGDILHVIRKGGKWKLVPK